MRLSHLSKEIRKYAYIKLRQLPKNRIKWNIVSRFPAYYDGYMTSDRIEYIGLYHKYLTGEIFTKGLYDPNKSIPLIPYSQESIDVQTFKKNKPKIKTNFQSPTQYYLIPNNEDIKKKYTTWKS